MRNVKVPKYIVLGRGSALAATTIPRVYGKAMEGTDALDCSTAANHIAMSGTVNTFLAHLLCRNNKSSPLSPAQHATFRLSTPPNSPVNKSALRFFPCIARASRGYCDDQVRLYGTPLGRMEHATQHATHAHGTNSGILLRGEATRGMRSLT